MFKKLLNVVEFYSKFFGIVIKFKFSSETSYYRKFVEFRFKIVAIYSGYHDNDEITSIALNSTFKTFNNFRNL